MRQRKRAWTLGPGLVAVAAVAGDCGPAQEPPLQLSLEQLGETLFTEEKFGGNGRVCSTCHELDQFGTITPEFVQELHGTDPEALLFRAIDSDDGLGESYARLKEHATVRVLVETAIDESTGLSIRKCDAPEETTVVLQRGVPSVFNVALEQALMVDGREGDDLEMQALNAIRAHSGPGREPTPDELTAIAAFEASLFSHAAVKAFQETGAGLGLPDGRTPSEIRGRAFFEPDRQCGICHSGPMLNRTSEFHPATVGSRFETVLVGAERDNPNEKFHWCFVDPETNEVVPGPSRRTRVFPAPVADPGTVLNPGPFTFVEPDGTERTLSRDRFVTEVPLPLFKIPTLWGTPNTAPYFHDNSANDLDDVLDQYNFMFRALRSFAVNAGCDADAPDCLSDEDRADIIAFLQLLSFEETAFLQPPP